MTIACVWGKLKRPVGRRKCKKPPKGKKAKRPRVPAALLNGGRRKRTGGGQFKWRGKWRYPSGG
jgi:hypothetical protein